MRRLARQGSAAYSYEDHSVFYSQAGDAENLLEGEHMSLKEIIPDSVAILSPCANSIEPKAYQSAMSIASNASANGYNVRFVGVTERMLIHTARNVLAEGFLETDCEWSFWLDSDMVLPANTITVMMKWAKKLKAQFLTGIYYQRVGEHLPVVLIRDEKVRKYEDEFSHTPVFPPEGVKSPFKVGCCGFGCVLIHRDVYSKLERPFFKYKWINEKKELSEDFYFCLNAKKAGVDLWAIPELNCGHIGEAPIVTRKDYKPVKTAKIPLETYEEKVQ